jgi:hypothetical protein
MRFLIVAILATANAVAAPVTELKPAELGAFLARHEYVVVQLTSPDASCKYCVGADKGFNEAAGLPHKPGLAFARVQWSPWNKFPDLSKHITEVYGLPSQFVFHKGKVLKNVIGRPESGVALLANVDAVIADPSAPLPWMVAKPEAPAKPYSDSEQGVARLGIRRDFLMAVSAACGSKYPEHAQQYKDAVQAWRGANESGLKQADLLMITRTSRADASAMGPLVEAEKKNLQAWQTDKLGISQQKAPTMADCDKLTGSLATLP